MSRNLEKILYLTVTFLIAAMTFWSGDSMCSAEEKAMKESPKQQCQRLMDAMLPFAEEMLGEHGEFYPFGGALDLDGKVVNQAVWTGEDHPPSDGVIKVLHEELKKGAIGGDFVATALIYDVRVVPPGRTEKSDAVAVDIDHREGISQTVIYPYSVIEGNLIFGETYAINMQHPVFER